MRRLPSLIALRFFEETARHLSFSRAAEALCVTQGAVSRQIRLLEEALGLSLFERDHKGVRLTPAGQQLLPRIAQAFDVIEDAARQLRPHAERSLLHIAVPPTFATQCLTPRLGSLAQALPDVDLSVRTDEQAEGHCCIRFGRTPLPEQSSELLLTERHSLVGAAGLTPPLTALLDRLPALHVLYHAERLQLWPAWLARAGLPAFYVTQGIEFSTLEQAIHAARKGVGLAIVDVNMISEELQQGSLIRLSEVEVHGPFSYWLDIPPRHAALPQVQAFAAWLREQVAML